MSILSNAKYLPRAATNGYLRVLRLPLNAAERLAGDRVDETWTPTVAFEAFEAGVETGVGTLTRDKGLMHSARLRRAKVAKLRKASALETIAEEQRAQADQTFESRRETAQNQRTDAARRAEQRQAELTRAADLHEEKAGKQAAEKTAAARRTKAKQDEAIDRQERTAKVEALSAEAKALKTAKAAIDAEDTAELVSDTLEGHKQDRKTS